MKKTVISPNRVSRESKANPNGDMTFATKIAKSKCTSYLTGSKIITYDNGYSKIVSVTDKKR